MDTPICSFVRVYRDKQALRAHMPGHKGAPVLGFETLDITEIDGADVLYHAEGIIRRSEENAAALFDSQKTLYSTEGSSLSIRAMLTLTLWYAKAEGKRPRIAAGRNAHKVFMSAAALLDIEVAWLTGEEDHLLSCTITPRGLESALQAMPELPIAVYLTTPDYLGNMADVRGLAEVCHRYGVLLLVDHAHGAYLHFLPESRHALTLGADLCCDSAHKTLPALTGAGYLHISHRAPAPFAEQAERAMSLFASTSPSYLILQSLDALNPILAGEYRGRLSAFVSETHALKQRLIHGGYPLVGEEPLKLTLAPKAYGYTGEELAAALAERNVVCEFADRDFTVLMLTPELGNDGLRRLEHTLLALPKRSPIQEPMLRRTTPERVTSIRTAMLSSGREVPVEQALGKVLADATLSCPPAIPILVSGERIDENAIRCMRYYGVTHCRVLDES